MNEKNTRILLVEDDREFVRLVEHVLRQKGYLVEAAYDAQTALAAWKTHSSDALVVDYHLPDQNGLEFLRQLGDVGPLPPTIMLTAMEDETIGIEALHVGVETFLTKESAGTFRELLPIYLDRALSRTQLQKEKHQAEEQLREQCQMFHSVSECALDGIIVMDDQGKIVHWNPAAERIFGYPVEEAVGHDVHALLTPPEKRTQAAAGVANFLQTGEGPVLGQMLELEAIRRDGTRIPVELSVAAVPKSSCCRAVAIVRDISTRKRMELELQNRTDQLRFRLKELHCLFRIYQLLEDPEVPLEETLTKAVRLIRSAWQYPEITCARLVLQDKVFTTNNYQETLWKLAVPIWVGTTLTGALEVCYLQPRPQADIGPFLNEERSLLTVLAGHLGRIIDHLQTQQHIRQLKRQIEFILAATHTNLFVMDVQKNLLYVDPGTQQIYGDPTGRTCCDYFWGMEGMSGICELDGRADGEVVHSEATLPKENHRPVQLSSTAFQNEKGERLFATVMIDLTERKRIETELAQSQKLEALGRLAAGIAHELNTPAQYIQNNLHFLQEAFDALQKELDYSQKLQASLPKGQTSPRPPHLVSSDDLDFLCQEIPQALVQSAHGIEQIATIVRAMKQFAEPRSDGKQSVHLNVIIQSTLTLCQNEWQYVAEVVSDLDPHLPPVPGVAYDLHQVVLNLVVNAAQAIQESSTRSPDQKGIITVSSRQVGPWAELRVSDTGVGIPPENRSKIFDPFFTTREVGQGCGQGLTLVRAIVVEQHNGSIEVESEVGRGSTFIVRLPLERPVQSSNPVPSDAGTGGTSGLQCPLAGDVESPLSGMSSPPVPLS